MWLGHEGPLGLMDPLEMMVWMVPLVVLGKKDQKEILDLKEQLDPL